VGTIPVTDQGEVDIRLLSEVPSWTDRERSIALEQLQRWGNVAIESRSDEGIFIQNDPVDPRIGPAQAPSTDEPNASDAPNAISSNEPLSIVTGPALDTGKAPATLFEALKEVAQNSTGKLITIDDRGKERVISYADLLRSAELIHSGMRTAGI